MIVALGRASGDAKLDWASTPIDRHVRQHLRQPVLRHVVRRIARTGDRLRGRWLSARHGTGRSRHPARTRSQKPGTSRHVTQRREAGHGGDPVRRVRRPDYRHADRAADPQRGSRSKDYATIAETFRPGHADYTYWQKYGIRDYRGGGRQSARETAVRVAAGAIAKKWLRERYGVVVRGHLTQLGPIAIPFERLGRGRTPIRSSSPMHRRWRNWKTSWIALRKSGDSVGARIRWWRRACRWAGASPSTASSTPTSPRR